MLRGIALIAVVIVLVYLAVERRQDRFQIPKALDGHTLICTACATGDDVPSFPLAFAARFARDGVFWTAGAPPPGEMPPPAQEGTYTYKRAGAGRYPGVAASATLKLRQARVGVASTLLLDFTHAAGGTFEGTIFRDGEFVAEQIGSFHLCVAPGAATRAAGP